MKKILETYIEDFDFKGDLLEEDGYYYVRFNIDGHEFIRKGHKVSKALGDLESYAEIMLWSFYDDISFGQDEEYSEFEDLLFERERRLQYALHSNAQEQRSGKNEN